MPPKRKGCRVNVCSIDGLFRRMRLLSTVAAGGLVALVLSTTASGIPGDLDPAFGQGGTATIGVAGVAATAHAVVLQPNGKIVVAGGDESGALVRYTEQGALDYAFNHSG